MRASRGAFTLTKRGPGTLQFNETGNDIGALDFDDGIIALGTTDVFDPATTWDLDAGTSLNLNGNDQEIVSLAGDGTVENDTGGSTTAVLTIAAGADTFMGSFTDSTGDVSATDVLQIDITGGSQTFSLVGTGNYVGDLNVTGGTLTVTTLTSFGGAGDTNVSGGGALELAFGASTTVSQAINIEGGAGVGALVVNTNDVVLDGGLTLTDDASIEVQGGGILLEIQGAGITESATSTLTKLGSGTLEFDVVAGYTGDTDVQAGTLRLGTGGQIVATALNVALAGSGEFDLGGNDQSVTQITGDGSITSTTGTAELSVTGTSAFDGTLTDGAGTLALRAVTGSDLTLNGASDYNGQTNIETGATITITDADALGADTAGVGMDDTVVASGGQLVLSFAGDAGEELTLEGNALAADTTATVSGDIVLFGAGATIDVDGGGPVNLTLSGDITGSALTKTGADILTLSGSNTYAGLTDIQDGTLALGSTTGIMAGNTVNVATAGTLDLNSNDISVVVMAGSDGTITNTSGTAELTIAGTTTLDVLLTDGGGGSGGGGTLDLRPTNAATTLTNNANDYNGQTNIEADTTIRMDVANALGATGAAANTVVADGGTLEVAFAGTSGEALSLDGAGVGGVGALKAETTAEIPGDVTLAGDATINVDDVTAGNIDLTLSGDVSGGANGLTKIGADTLVLSGNNGYTGATNIDVGVLQAGSDTAIDSASDVTMMAGATFDVNDQSLTIGSLDGGTGILDLGLGSLTATSQIDLTGMTVNIAAAGNAAQTLDAGTALTTESLTKGSPAR